MLVKLQRLFASTLFALSLAASAPAVPFSYDFSFSQPGGPIVTGSFAGSFTPVVGDAYSSSTLSFFTNLRIGAVTYSPANVILEVWNGHSLPGSDYEAFFILGGNSDGLGGPAAYIPPGGVDFVMSFIDHGAGNISDQIFVYADGATYLVLDGNVSRSGAASAPDLGYSWVFLAMGIAGLLVMSPFLGKRATMAKFASSARSPFIGRFDCASFFSRKLFRAFSLAAVVSSVSIAGAATPVSVTPPTINLSIVGTPDELIALEKQKVDYLFGTPEQKQLVLRTYAEDFNGVHVGPRGPGWANYAGVVAHRDMFPNLPAGTFILTDFHVTVLAAGCCVVSYKVTGPGPDGAPWAALNSSVWVKRGREWKTVFYQSGPISGS